MRGPWTTLLNEAGNFEAGFWDQCGWWIADSVHDSSRDAKDRASLLNANNVLADGLPEKLARHPALAPTPGQLIRLETGDWVDPAEVVGIEYGIDFPIIRLRGRGKVMVAVHHEGRGITHAQEAHDLVDRIAAQINAARAGKGGER